MRVSSPGADNARRDVNRELLTCELNRRETRGKSHCAHISGGEEAVMRSDVVVGEGEHRIDY